MDCVEEVALLKRELVPLLGSDERLGFDVLNGKLSVDLSQADVTSAEVSRYAASMHHRGATVQSCCNRHSCVLRTIDAPRSE